MMSFLQKLFNIMSFMKHFQCFEAEDHALSVLGMDDFIIMKVLFLLKI